MYKVDSVFYGERYGIFDLGGQRTNRRRPQARIQIRSLRLGLIFHEMEAGSG